LLIALTSISLLAPQAYAAQSTPLADGDSDQLQAVLPDAHEDIAAVIDSGLTSYTIDVTMSADTDGGHLVGTVHIVYLNDTGSAINDVPLRLYANGHDDPITIVSAEVDGTVVEPELSVYRTVATLPLAEELAAGETVDLSIAFEADVPFGNVNHYGIFGIDETEQTWALAHWYPLVAGWVEGEGWELDPPSVNGDPIFSTTSTYDVTIHAPADLKLVTTGVAVDQETDDSSGAQTSRFVTGPVRDFTIVADDEFVLTSTDVDGTIVNSWYLPHEERNGAKVAEYAARALEYYNEEIGPYPFAELDVLSVEVYGALGVEFPQLIYMARNYYTRDLDLEAPNALEFTVSHEVLHQWWYSMVGNNQYDHAFIDEGLTNYISGDLYFRHVYGEEAGEAFSHIAFRDSYEQRSGLRGDQLVDMPTDDFPGNGEYVYAMYFKGAMGFAAIEEEIGREAFFEGLRLYFDRFRFGIAQPEDLQAAFEEASGVDLDEIWQEWFEEVEA
jgi:hypothetical protein